MNVNDNFFTNPLDIVDNSVDQIFNSLNALNTKQADKIIVDFCIEKLKNLSEIIKIVKREIKHVDLNSKNQNNIAVLNQIISKLDVIKRKFYAINKNKIKKTAEINEAANVVLQAIDAVHSRAEKKRKLLLTEREFTNQQVPRLDKLLQSLENEKLLMPEIKGILMSLISKMHLKNNVIYPQEISNLDEMLRFIEVPASPHERNETMQELIEFIKHLKAEINESINQKLTLINQIYHSMKAGQGDGSQQKDAKYYAVMLRQVLENPFDIPIDYSIILNHITPDMLEGQFQESMIMSQKSIEPDENTLAAKMAALKLIRAEALKRNKETHPVLISGAGPGGLMVGLVSSIQGKPFTILESRPEDAELRGNILAFGKEDSSEALSMLSALGSVESRSEDCAADIKLLDFFGITNRLLIENKILPREKNSLLSIRLEDLQKAMVQQLEELNRNEQADGRAAPLIYYGVQINQIQKNGPQNQAEVFFTSPPLKKSSAGGTDQPASLLPKSIQPSMIYVMEGYRTATRDLLGIDVSKQSKRADLVFSFFQRKEASKLERKRKSIANYIKNFPDLLKMYWRSKVTMRGHAEEEISFNTWRQGELLLRTPGTDYLYHTVSTKEQLAQKKFEANLKKAQTACGKVLDAIYETLFKDANSKDVLEITTKTQRDKLNSQLLKCFGIEDRSWIGNDSQRKQILADLIELESLSAPRKRKQLAKLRSQFNKSAQTIANLREKHERAKIKNEKEWHSRQNFIKKLLGEKQEMGEYKKTVAASSQVQAAETNYRRIGATHVYVGGDAETTTDPVSGSGCRTTLLRTVMAAAAFNNPARRENTFTASAFAWASHLSARSMREEGLQMRQYYKKGTERFERYLDIAIEKGRISKEQKKFLLYMQGKLKSMHEFRSLKLTQGEQDKLREIQRNILENYKNSYPGIVRITTRKEEILGAWQAAEPQFAAMGLTKAEVRAFGKAWMAAMREEAPDFAGQGEMDAFKAAAAKVALYRRSGMGAADPDIYLPEADFVYLSVTVHQILAKGT